MDIENCLMIGDQRISVILQRSKRRRRSIGFTMKDPSALRITAPMRASRSEIHSALQKQTGWIRRRLAQMQKAQTAHPPPTYQEGTNVTYLGRFYGLNIVHDQALPQGCVLRPHRLIVTLHHDGEALQEDARLEILLWMKRRAKVKFRKRMDRWAARLGVRYRKLAVGDAEKRWGSCNASNAIRLNWRLIMAPLPILDYVVVHELCHVRHKNHGTGFWRQVESVIPDWKKRRHHLHSMSHSLII